jgi:hypothetical protein
LALNSGIQTYQILTNNDEVCIPSLSSILLAAYKIASLGVNDGWAIAHPGFGRIEDIAFLPSFR